ncbi:MAG: GPP34 family phosphoprotein [Thermocrispum agreste]|uniref:GPP34 family phosphoprotein n=1 Tax=Thermocrispum agreste TaxID=37925 RepID=A0ABD6FHX3_9PSEU
MLLAEELLLLAYDDHTGRQAWGSNIDYALAGAVLIELADLDHVRLDGTGRKARLVVRSTSPTGHPVLDAWQGKVADQAGRKPKDVVGKLATGLRERLLDHLAQRGILRKERDRILGLFPTTRWPAHDSTHEAELRAHLRRALVDGVQPEPRLAALIALLHAVDAVPRVVGAADRKLAKQRAKAIAEGNWASDATRKAIEEMTAVVATAAIIPVITAAGS